MNARSPFPEPTASSAADPPRVGPAADPIRVAVVGLGYWGPNLLRVLSELDGVQVAWVCDLDRDRLDSCARRYPASAKTTDVDRILSDATVDALFIATPVYTHYDVARRSLEAGKHTFVEKPLAPSVAEAEELVATAAGRDILLMCGHTFIYSSPVQLVKRMLAQREIGDLYFISSSRVNLGLHQRDVSVIWDLGPHDFSILQYWLGEAPIAVRATGRDSVVSGIPDVAFVTLTFASGIVANVELSWLAPSKLRRTVVVGSERMIVYEDGIGEPIRVFDHGVVYRDPNTFGEYHLSYRTGDIVSPKLDSYEPLAAELGDFIATIRSGGSLREHAQLALDVVKITEAAEASLRSGGEEVRVPGLRRVDGPWSEQRDQLRIGAER